MVFVWILIGCFGKRGEGGVGDDFATYLISCSVHSTSTPHPTPRAEFQVHDGVEEVEVVARGLGSKTCVAKEL